MLVFQVADQPRVCSREGWSSVPEEGAVVLAVAWLLKPCFDYVYVGVGGSWLGIVVAAVVHKPAVGLLSMASAAVPAEEQAVARLNPAMMVECFQVDMQELLAAAKVDESQPGMHELQKDPAAGDSAAGDCEEAVMARDSLAGNFLAGCNQNCHKLLKPDAWPEACRQEAAELDACLNIHHLFEEVNLRHLVTLIKQLLNFLSA